jgi:frataxin-like iron-binding protein CyaY
MPHLHTNLYTKVQNKNHTIIAECRANTNEWFSSKQSHGSHFEFSIQPNFKLGNILANTKTGLVL